MDTMPLKPMDVGNAINSSQMSKIQSLSSQGDAAAIEQTAEDFESVFVSLLLKEMRGTLSEGLFGGESSDVLGGMFDQFMGQHLANSSALGIKQMIMKQWSPDAEVDVTEAAPAGKEPQSEA
jgi:Rod binding domain-containing protein